MSIIFNDLPLLEAERVSGALSQAEFAKQKSAALDSVPDTLKTDFTVVERSAPRSDTLWIRCCCGWPLPWYAPRQPRPSQATSPLRQH